MLGASYMPPIMLSSSYHIMNFINVRHVGYIAHSYMYTRDSFVPKTKFKKDDVVHFYNRQANDAHKCCQDKLSEKAITLGANAIVNIRVSEQPCDMYNCGTCIKMMKLSISGDAIVVVKSII